MAIKKRGLKKGLDALLAETVGAKSSKLKEKLPIPKDKKPQNVSNEIKIDLLSPGRFQPRREIVESDLESLVNSIKEQGVLQPIVVRTKKNNSFEILAGERRWRSARLAGLKTVPVVIKDVSDEAALAIGIIENIQRENLNPIEEAVSLSRLAKEFSLTHDEVAKAVGKSRAVVTNLLRLLNLRDDVRILLERSEIEIGHAKVLLALQGAAQSQVAKIVVQKQLSVRETEKLVANFVGKNNCKNKSKKSIDPDIKRLQTKLSNRLNAGVDIKHGNKGNGTVTISYSSLDELEGILDVILH